MIRTQAGNLRIRDNLDITKHMTISGEAAGIMFTSVNTDTNERVSIYFGGAELDALAAEILRIREERSI